jgi:hypothetical protein
MLRGLVPVAFASFGVMCALHPACAFADVVISTAATKNMVLSNGVYSPTTDKAVLNVNDLTNALNAGALEVATGAVNKSGDIAVEAALHWVSGNALTLDAFHSIRVDQPVTDAGSGALTLTTNDGSTSGHLEFGASGNIGFWGLGNALTINGQPYTLVNNVASLAAAITANPSGNYALAANYDAKVDHTYKQDPITTTFEGNFEGLGNTISNVSIRAPEAAIGFFGTINTSASVSDFRLENIRVVQTGTPGGSIGGLAAFSYGSLSGDEVTGTLTFGTLDSAGGLVGRGSGSITQCSSNVAMTSKREFGRAAEVGGLAGSYSGTIVDSFASGDVPEGFETTSAGGLVGYLFGGAINHSHATGNVTGDGTSATAGGLVGFSFGPVSDSYATGDVEGAYMVGGLVGSEGAAIERSFATGRVRATPRAFTMASGSLVGYIGNFGSPNTSTLLLNNSYATGTVAGTGAVGGLIGNSNSTSLPISNSYATGKIAAGQPAGGFAGTGCQCFANDYWDITTSGTTNGVGGGNAPGVTGDTTAQLQAGLPPGFDPKIWAEDKKINHGLPYLIANPPPQ